MKIMRKLLLILINVVALTYIPFAQGQFSGFDDFTDNNGLDQSKWGDPIGNDTAVSFITKRTSLGDLNVLAISRGNGTSGEFSTQIPWSKNLGSSKSNWTAKVDLNFPEARPISLLPSDFLEIGFLLTELNSGNKATLTVLRTRDESVRSEWVSSNKVSGTNKRVSASSTNGTIRLSYNSTNKTMSSSYSNDGSSFSDIDVWDVSNWTTTGNERFQISLYIKYSFSIGNATLDPFSFRNPSSWWNFDNFSVSQDAIIVPPTLTLSDTSQSFAPEGGSHSFTVNSNSSWSWSSNSGWITSSESSPQSNNQTFAYTVASNPSTSSRTGTIVFTAGGVSRTHTVTQSGKILPTLTLSDTTQSFAPEGGSHSFNVNSNSSWSWSSNSSWINSSESSPQSNNQTFAYTVASNPSTSSRTGTIVFTAGGVSRTHTVTQDGKILPTLTLSDTTQSFAPEGGSHSFTVNSNSSWSWSSNSGWITSSESSPQSNNQTFAYTVASNPSTSSRTGTIVFTAGEVTRSHTVTQDGKILPTLTLSDTTQSFAPEGGSHSFTVNSNSSWSWSSNSGWISSSESSPQSNNQTFAYTVASNPSTSSRTGTIVFTAGDVTRTHTITQSEKIIEQVVPVSIHAASLIRFSSQNGVTYQLEKSDDLISWTPENETLTGDGTERQFVIESNKPKEFYRVLSR